MDVLMVLRVPGFIGFMIPSYADVLVKVLVGGCRSKFDQSSGISSLFLCPCIIYFAMIFSSPCELNFCLQLARKSKSQTVRALRSLWVFQFYHGYVVIYTEINMF